MVVSILLLIGYVILTFSTIRYGSYGPNYSGKGTANRWFNPYGGRTNQSGKKLSVDQVKARVNDYISEFDNNLEISDIFVYKDTDYYVSIEEKDTGKGAMELLVNPYTGDIYPEYGPNMMWNQKYGSHGGRGFGMMSPYGRNMMRRTPWNRYSGYYSSGDTTKKIGREEAVRIADEYAKNNIGSEFSVLNKGHEFYGYYTFHVNKGENAVGMLSFNYFTGDVWYHNWHGQLEQVISDHKE